MIDSISKQKNTVLPDKNVQIDIFKTYISTIEKSVGSTIFQNIYGKINGEEKDLSKGGKRSCARYASAILLIAGLIEGMHATVDGTVRDMEKSGWYKIDKPRKGAVLVWGPGPESEGHSHIGFYMNNNKAISNSTKKKIPTRHSWTYGKDKKKNPKRPPISIWWHDKLGD
ncbi:MAG: CHAP domain-containing protein [Candidatus Spechtbacterales bacterium]|nr:CHAP domain-containing protein [Candidatus Spechtbacterales bacterium]